MPTLIAGTGVPAAAGYPQYSGNLIMPIYAQRMLERFYMNSIFSEVATTDVLNEIGAQGDTAIFRRAPKVYVRDYAKSQTLTHDVLESDTVKVTIGHAYYFSFMMSRIDMVQIANSSNFISEAMNSAAHETALSIDRAILSTAFTSVDVLNRGANAGAVSASNNLGEVGAPVVINRNNVLESLIRWGSVLDEQNVPQDNRWVIVPTQFRDALMNSNLANASFMGSGASPMLNGLMPNMIAGFNIYVSNNLTRVIDAGTNQPCWNIMFGRKGSLAFISQLSETRTMQDANSFNEHMQGLMVWGAGVVQPEAMGHVYATIS